MRLPRDKSEVTIGSMRTEIQIYKRSGVQDALGQETLQDDPYEATFAQIVPLTGRELFNARQVQADVTHEVRFRWVDGVNPRDKIVAQMLDGDRNFEILSIVNSGERDRIAICQCVERV